MNQQREQRLLNQYLQENFRDKPQWTRVRLGPAATKGEARLFKVGMRWADAIVKNGDEILIFEAKLRPDAGAIGQLQVYSDLFRKTPEFSDFATLPIRMIFLTTKLDMGLKSQTDRLGIEYVVFNPPWVATFLQERLNLPRRRNRG